MLRLRNTIFKLQILNSQNLQMVIHEYPWGLAGSLMNPEENIYSFSTKGPDGPRVIRMLRPRGKVDMDYIY